MKEEFFIYYCLDSLSSVLAEQVDYLQWWWPWSGYVHCLHFNVLENRL